MTIQLSQVSDPLAFDIRLPPVRQIRPTASLYGMLRQIKFFTRDYDGAAAAFYKATSLDPENPQSYENWLDYGDQGTHLCALRRLQQSQRIGNTSSNSISPKLCGTSLCSECFHSHKRKIGSNERTRAFCQERIAHMKRQHALELARTLGYPEKYLKGDSVFDPLLQEKKHK